MGVLGADRFVLDAGADGGGVDSVHDLRAAEGDVLALEGFAPGSASPRASGSDVVVSLPLGDDFAGVLVHDVTVAEVAGALLHV